MRSPARAPRAGLRTPTRCPRGARAAEKVSLWVNPKTHRDRPDGSHAERYVSDLPLHTGAIRRFPC